MNRITLQPIYCPDCKKLLGKQRIELGEVELWCRYCKEAKHFTYSSKIIEDFLSEL